MGAIQDRLARLNVEKTIALKLATGKFADTGAKYSAEQAQADSTNAALRMTAKIDSTGKLVWSK